MTFIKLILPILLFSNPAFTYVRDFIPADEKKATLIINGQDSDASVLYDLINIEATQKDQVEKKEVDFISSIDEEAIFKIKCQKSKAIQNIGSCTFEIFNKPSGTNTVTINKTTKRVLLEINEPDDIATVSNMFNNSGQDVYRSELNQLIIWRNLDENDEITSMTVEYYK